jgi:N-acetylglucosaminyldiphosphoundecaprenol N-acetyl-beta-D-mannosaminyltransferase
MPNAPHLKMNAALDDVDATARRESPFIPASNTADSVLGFLLTQLDANDAVAQIAAQAKAGSGGFVCVTNAHSLVEAYSNADLAKAFTNAFMLLPDSMIVQKARAFLHNTRVPETLYGVQLMHTLCHAAQEQGLRIGLFGGSPSTLDALREKLLRDFPDLKIVYAHSPPYRIATDQEEQAQTRAMRSCGVQLLFVGLGAPKQEIWMAQNAAAAPDICMIGVGAAFDGLAGTVKPPPVWLHKAGFVWAFRLLSEPRRLWKRYLTTSPIFAWRVFKQKFAPAARRNA